MQPAGEKADTASYHAGEEIAVSGLYRVFHSGHRTSHEVVVRAREKFPRCSKCKDNVLFELLQAAPEIEQDRDFIRVHEIPHPEEAKSGKVVA